MRDWFWYYFSQTGDPEGYMVYAHCSKLEISSELTGPSDGQGTDVDDLQDERYGDSGD